MEKRKILIIIGTYLPGRKGGGPVRTIENLIERLGEEYDFRVLTSSHDIGENEAYEGISPYVWTKQGKADVFYVGPGHFTEKNVLIASEGVDVIFICGCFNDYARTTLRLHRKGILNKPIAVASMGLFGKGAIQIKSIKKRIYINTLKFMGYFKDISWIASSCPEELDIKREIGQKAKCVIAKDLPVVFKRELIENRMNAEVVDSILRIVFLGRISPEKNLDYALDILRNVKAQVAFSIIGPIGDAEYWGKCKMHMAELGTNVKCEYLGVADGGTILNTLSHYDVMFLPTKTENYGHAIYEAFAAGVIPVISDRTIWTGDIQKNDVGRVCSLDNTQEFVMALEEYAAMDQSELNVVRKRIINYMEEYDLKIDLSGYKTIFEN